MYEVTPENAADYLRETKRVSPDVSVEVRWLAWGVSNVVLLVRPEGRPAFVLKQSRAQLRTKAEWFSRLDRIWREMDVMTALEPLLPAGSVPKILFEDRPSYLFAMEAVDPSHVVWKEELLAGTADLRVAEQAGRLLGAIHRTTHGRDDLRQQLGDREVFDQLRLDPFYRRVARVYPDLKRELDRLIEESLSRSECVVHADFSPKNLLIVRKPGAGPSLALVDYETGHFGDPAFDIGFLFSHLLLKTALHSRRRDEFLELARTVWDNYLAELSGLAREEAFETSSFAFRSSMHLGGCLLARIDGKSTIDYLPDPCKQDYVRAFARELLFSPPDDFRRVFERFNLSAE